MNDVTSFPCILLALQNTRFPLSSLTTVFCTEEIVFTRPPLLTRVDLDRLVMSPADLYHVMLAGGMQYDVVHVRLICCPIITVIGVVITDKLTSCTGTIKEDYTLLYYPRRRWPLKNILNKCIQYHTSTNTTHLFWICVCRVLLRFYLPLRRTCIFINKEITFLCPSYR